MALCGSDALDSGTWQAPHPDWTPDEPWPQEVSSYAIDDGARLLRFDPLAAPDELLELAADRKPVVVLTAPWHERDTQSLVDRLGTTVFTPPPDTAQDLIDKFGVIAEQAGDGSPDLRWLSERRGDARWYAAGNRLPIGIEAFEGRGHNDLVLWVDRVGAVISGDTLAGFGEGLKIADWLRAGVTREAVAERLSPLLEPPVEVVLAATEYPPTGPRSSALSPDRRRPSHSSPSDGAFSDGAFRYSRARTWVGASDVRARRRAYVGSATLTKGRDP